MSFARSLEVGRVAESLIATWLQSRGHAIMPAYEIEKATGKGPQLFSAGGNFVSPDMLMFAHSGMYWVEAKHKKRFTWHRLSRQWTTGIDLRHYGEYLEVEERTRVPVWLMFFHRQCRPSESDINCGCPAECPTGLFGEKLRKLADSENHRTMHYDQNRAGMTGHGRSGMVYWASGSLRLLATVSELRTIVERQKLEDKS